MARRFGLSLDNVRAVDIVTADGELRHASAEENPELFWGVRGGGGNFGVVTNFEFELHPMQREVVGGNIAFPFSKARQLLDFYAEYEASAPDELFLCMGLQNSPEGQAVSFNACYSGPAREAERVFAKVRAAGGTPLRDTLRTIDYVALQRSGDVDDPRAVGSYTKSGFSAGLKPKFIDAILDGFGEQPGGSSVFFLYHCGGADQPRGRRRHGVPAPRDHAHAAARRELADDERPDGAGRVAAQVLGERRAAHAGLLHQRHHRRDAEAGRRELPRQLPAARGAEEPVRPDEPVPAERERHPERVGGVSERRLPETAAARTAQQRGL